MPLRAGRIVLAIGGVLCVACTPADRATGDRTGTITERAGDTIVVRTVGVPDSATLRLRTELRIGELDGGDEYGFGRVSAIAPAPGGGVYVLDDLVKSIRQYDSAGRYVRQVARRGRGPGEHDNVAGMAAVDGMLVFWDKSNQYVSVYDSAGTLAHRWRPAYPGAPMGALYAGSEGRVYLWHHVARPPSTDDFEGFRTGYVGYDVRGTPGADTLPHVNFGEQDQPMLRAEGRRGVMSAPVPHGAGSISVLSPLGYLVQGRSDRYALTLARTGAPPLRIVRDVAPVPVHDEERAEEEARVVAEMRVLDPDWSWSGDPIPETKPFFRTVHFDADGRLWVERARASERIPDAEIAAAPERRNVFGALPPRRWREPLAYDLFEPDGRFLGTVARPSGASFLYMHGDTVWGVVRDSLDVPYVTRWRIKPSIVK